MSNVLDLFPNPNARNSVTSSPSPLLDNGAELRSFLDGEGAHPRSDGCAADTMENPFAHGSSSLMPSTLYRAANLTGSGAEIRSLMDEYGPQNFAQASQAIIAATESLYRVFTELEARLPAFIADDDVAMGDSYDVIPPDDDDAGDRQT